MSNHPDKPKAAIRWLLFFDLFPASLKKPNENFPS
jgi:hypothetical protein